MCASCETACFSINYSLYSKYVSYCIERGSDLDHPSKSIFVNVLNSRKWKAKLKVRVQTDVGVCGICLEFDRAFKCLPRWSDDAEYLELQRRREVHRSVWAIGRTKYNHRKLTGQNLNDILSMTLDGAENNNTTLIHESGSAAKNGLAPDSTISFKLQGVIAHGIGLYLYVIHEWVPKGANMAVTSLHNTLVRLKDSLPAGKTLPRVLSITCDGGTENWNRTMLAYLNVLVIKKIFDRIDIQRLTVGHGHTDLDGVFGVCSCHIHGTTTRTGVSCYTPKEFVDEITAATSGCKLKAIENQRFNWDFVKWLAPRVDKQFSGHGSGARPLFAFNESVCYVRIHRHKGKAKMMYKTQFDVNEEEGFLPGEKHLGGEYRDGFEYFEPEEERKKSPVEESETPVAEEINANFGREEVPELRQAFRGAFEAGCGASQAKERGVDYAACWDEWFDSVPNDLEGVFRGSPQPNFSLPDLGSAFVNTLERNQLKLTRKEEQEKAQREEMFVMPITFKGYTKRQQYADRERKKV